MEQEQGTWDIESHCYITLPCLTLPYIALPRLASPCVAHPSAVLLWTTGSSREETCLAGMAGAGWRRACFACLLACCRCCRSPVSVRPLRSSLVGSDSLEYDGDVRAQLQHQSTSPC